MIITRIFYNFKGLFTYDKKDKEERPLLWIKFSHHTRNDRERAKNFLIYIFEQFERQSGKNGYILVSEWVDARPANVGIDLALFVVNILQSHFPLGLRQIIQLDMPEHILAFAPEILPYLPELNKTLVWIPHKNLSQYIDPQNYPTEYKTWLSSHPITL